MNCDICPLNTCSKKYDKKMLLKAPVDLHAFFVCKGMNAYIQEPVPRHQICPKTIWTVVYIGTNDEFALSQASAVFEDLIEGGHAELLCSMFENASYQLRKQMWLKMTSKYLHKLYLFDPLFEKQDLEPYTDAKHDDLYQYRYYLFHGNLSFAHNYKRG